MQKRGTDGEESGGSGHAWMHSYGERTLTVDYYLELPHQPEGPSASSRAHDRARKQAEMDSVDRQVIDYGYDSMDTVFENYMQALMVVMVEG